MFNTLADIGHKIFSPKTYNCPLCEITHSYFTMRGQWKHLVNMLPFPVSYLHRDQFYEAKLNVEVTEFPVVLLQKDQAVTVLLDRGEIESFNTVTKLVEGIIAKLIALNETSEPD